MPSTDNGSVEAIFPNYSWLVVESPNKDLEKRSNTLIEELSYRECHGKRSDIYLKRIEI